VGRCPAAHTCVTVYACPHNLDSHVAAHAAFNAQVSGAWVYIPSMATQPGGRGMFMSIWMRTIGNEVNDARLRRSIGQPHRSGIGGCRSGCCTLLLRGFAGDQLLGRSFRVPGSTATFLLVAGFLVVWLPLDAHGSRPVLAREWQGHVSVRRLLMLSLCSVAPGTRYGLTHGPRMGSAATKSIPENIDDFYRLFYYDISEHVSERRSTVFSCRSTRSSASLDTGRRASTIKLPSRQRTSR
jgi:hypothetical protein